MIYFDFTATTKPRKEVLDVYNKINNEYWFNPSSFYKAGVINHNLFDECEANILKYLNIQNKRVFFTSGATEANNLAIYGICNNYLNQNKHIITSKIEHPSVMSCFKDLENALRKAKFYIRCKLYIIKNLFFRELSVGGR